MPSAYRLHRLPLRMYPRSRTKRCGSPSRWQGKQPTVLPVNWVSAVSKNACTWTSSPLYTFSVAGGTCHHDRRKRTSHSKRYYSRIEKEIAYKERCHPLRNGIHQSYSVGFVFVHLKKDLVELFLLLLGFGREELVASKRNIFLSAVLLTV